jgi:hypothetical protein
VIAHRAWSRTVLADENARTSRLCAEQPGIAPAKTCEVMRRDDEEDRKNPEPLAVTKKGTNAPEAAEGRPWLNRRDDRADRHRHVV